MKFSARDDIPLSVSQVFAAYADFADIERQLMRRGIAIQRAANGPAGWVGTAWKASAPYRGKLRKVEAEVTRFVPDEGFTIAFKGKGVEGEFTADFIALARTRSRVSLSTDVRPTSLSGRLVLQSLKLAKATMDKRYKSRASDFATNVGRQAQG